MTLLTYVDNRFSKAAPLYIDSKHSSPERIRRVRISVQLTNIGLLTIKEMITRKILFAPEGVLAGFWRHLARHTVNGLGILDVSLIADAVLNALAMQYCNILKYATSLFVRSPWS